MYVFIGLSTGLHMYCTAQLANLKLKFGEWAAVPQIGNKQSAEVWTGLPARACRALATTHRAVGIASCCTGHWAGVPPRRAVGAMDTRRASGGQVGEEGVPFAPGTARPTGAMSGKVGSEPVASRQEQAS